MSFYPDSFKNVDIHFVGISTDMDFSELPELVGGRQRIIYTSNYGLREMCAVKYDLPLFAMFKELPPSRKDRYDYVVGLCSPVLNLGLDSFLRQIPKSRVLPDKRIEPHIPHNCSVHLNNWLNTLNEQYGRN